jgi:hypothetical protein
MKGFWTTLPFALLLTAGACTQDGGPASNIADDAGNVSDATDSSFTQPSYTGCTQSLDAWCAMPNAGCIGDWTTALRTALLRVCTGLGTHPDLVEVCGSYNVLGLSGTDIGADEYYDGTSGTLVAVVEVIQSPWLSQICLEGPADFVPPPACSTSTRLCDLTLDGGGDAATVGSDAADSASE